MSAVTGWVISRSGSGRSVLKPPNTLRGEKKGEVGICISKRYAVVLALTDYVNHQLVAALKREARRQKKRIIFAPRAWSEIAPALQRVMGAGR